MRTAVADNYPTRDRNECTMTVRQDPVTWFDPKRGDTRSGPLTASQIADYDKRGYHSADAIIPPRDVFDLVDEMTRLADTDTLRGDNRIVRENSDGAVRSVFDVHRLSDVVDEIIRRPEVVGIARQILGSDVYVHQSRLNFKPGFTGGPFYWHSDFETWHAEDGMPAPRAASISIALTENYGHNGADDHARIAPRVRLVRRRDPRGLLQGIAGQLRSAHRLARSADAHPDGERVRHRHDDRTGGLRHRVRFQLHTRLERQHHAVRAVQPLHRVQQRREHADGPVLAPAPRPDYLAAGISPPCGNEHHDVPRPRSLTSERAAVCRYRETRSLRDAVHATMAWQRFDRPAPGAGRTFISRNGE